MGVIQSRKRAPSQVASKEVIPDVITFVREDIIGLHAPIQTPFGNRLLLYCDYTASGRLVKSLENYLAEEVYP